MVLTDTLDALRTEGNGDTRDAPIVRELSRNCRSTVARRARAPRRPAAQQPRLTAPRATGSSRSASRCSLNRCAAPRAPLSRDSTPSRKRFDTLWEDELGEWKRRMN